MKVKTSELIDQALNWAVAKCEGKNGVLHDDGITRCIVIAAPSGVYKGTWRPTINWAQGGPIIEREAISIAADTAGMFDSFVWFASVDDILVDSEEVIGVRGPTPLIAAMRAYVASKLGDTVEVPEELA